MPRKDRGGFSQRYFFLVVRMLQGEEGIVEENFITSKGGGKERGYRCHHHHQTHPRFLSEGREGGERGGKTATISGSGC